MADGPNLKRMLIFFLSNVPQVYRAKERVDLEVENMHRKEQEQNSKDQT